MGPLEIGNKLQMVDQTPEEVFRALRSIILQELYGHVFFLFSREAREGCKEKFLDDLTIGIRRLVIQQGLEPASLLYANSLSNQWIV